MRYPHKLSNISFLVGAEACCCEGVGHMPQHIYLWDCEFGYGYASDEVAKGQHRFLDQKADLFNLKSVAI